MISSLTAITSDTIWLVFNPLTLFNDTGNSPIIRYDVIYKDITDPNNFGSDVTKSFGLLTNSTVDTLTANKTY